MGASTSKRVLAYRFDRETVAGFVDPNTFLTANGIELLSPAGAHAVLPYAEVKALCFVKDFESPPAWRENRIFNVRPKTEGLWVRFRLHDNDVIDGLLPSNLLAWDSYGFTIAPPDPGLQGQRVFLPKASVAETHLMGVIGTRRPRAVPKPEGQLEMFDRS